MFGHAQLQKKKDDIVLIGLGPTGLAYALESCRSDSYKRNIVILTDRVDYTRDVIFRLDVDVFEYFQELIGEEAYQSALHKGLISAVQDTDVSGFFGQAIPHRVIKIRTAENLLYQQLSKIPQVKIITLPKHTQDQIISIQKNSNSIFYRKDNKTLLLHYSYLIEADGVQHSLLNLVKDHPYYHTTQRSQTHSHHARINFNIPSGYTADSFRELLKNGTQAKPTIAEFRELGWEHHSTPEFRLFVVEDVFYVGGECPYDIQTADKSKIEAWVRLSLSLFLSKEMIAKLTTRDRATFDVQLDETDNPTITLAPSHATPGILFLTGEALRKSHYQTGSGAAVGLQEAKAFGKFLKTRQSRQDLHEYAVNIKAIIATNRDRVNRYLNHRAERELAAQRPLVQNPSHHYTRQTANSAKVTSEEKLLPAVTASASAARTPLAATKTSSTTNPKLAANPTLLFTQRSSIHQTSKQTLAKHAITLADSNINYRRYY